MNLTKPPCAYCGGSDVVYLGDLPDSHWFAGRHLNVALLGGALFRCKICKLKYRSPIPEPVELSHLYDNQTHDTWPVTQGRPDWHRIAGYIFTHLPNEARVLDFGCYTGGLLDMLGARYERHGIEINSAAASSAQKHGNLTIWRALDDLPKTMKFDAIILCDVIEHMSDPGSFVHQLSERLQRNGRMIISTGDAENRLWNRFGANWWYCFYPEHISFISRSWLTYFLKDSNLTLEASENFRYYRLSRMRYLVDAVLTYFYGWAPNLYLRLARALRGTTDIESVPGNGISKDHLLVVLTKSKRGTAIV
jgi:2-polyprenyl-3-methyl-5-hydroxy-6-metoxy-1,4-benzoquinol methylase